MSPITPKIVRKILKGTNKSSSPGEDCITYCHLWKLPSTHHYLATLFSKILLHSQSAPSQWCSGIMKLIYKAGSPENPKNFRPIALTSCVGKLFHKILAIRLKTFFLHNQLIDPSIQKGFLRNCPGTYEHIFALNCILDQAQWICSPTMITFLDLKNAFGSIPHRLVFNILERIQIPSGVVSYIRSCYSQLTARIIMDKWSTSGFAIQKGVFQGDTLSPTIFLAAFTPIILRTQQSHYPGCKIAIPIPDSENLPPVNSTLYVKWDEESEEEKGWYRCLVTTHHLDGSSTLEYTDGQTEKVNLRSCDWRFAKKNNKKFVPLGAHLPAEPTKPPSKQQYVQSLEHKCKALADDLTILNQTRTYHQNSLLLVEESCNSLGLSLNPTKCVSITIENGKPRPDAEYSLKCGSTRNLRFAPTKFLGHTLASTPQETKKHGSSVLRNHLLSILSRIDVRPIRGEMKVWILRNYVIPSLQYQLAVNHTYKSCIAHLENQIAKMVRKWLKLPRNSTRVLLSHPASLNIPSISLAKTKAKLSLLCCLTKTSDPANKEISSLINNAAFLKRQDISEITQHHLQTALSTAPSSSATWPIAKSLVNEQALEEANRKLESLQVQKKFSDCTELESMTKVWKCIVDGLPAGQLSFILRCGSDTLPTPTNLRRWKIQVHARCHLCDSPQATAHHILNGCKRALEDGRYTWRHDSVLLKLVERLKGLLPSSTLYADLPNLRAEETPPTTIPPQLVCTSSRPDIVIVQDQAVKMIELTVCSNSLNSMKEARRRKEGKQNYQSLLSDLCKKGINASYLTLEIGALGHHPPDLPKRLADFLGMKEQKNNLRSTLDDAGKIAISTSQIIFWAKDCLSWDPSKLLLS